MRLLRASSRTCRAPPRTSLTDGMSEKAEATAKRIQQSMADLERLIAALREVKQKIVLCSICNNLTEVNPCRFCASTSRDHSVICVVEEPHSLVAVEKTRSFKGVYHVLHGSLSPIRHIGPSELQLANLLRLKPENNDGVAVKEVILATNPTTEGEATANYISRLLKPLGIRVTRIAMGMPVGSDLEYVDEVTMDKALANRHEI